MDASLIEQQLDKFNVWEEGAEFVHMRKVKIEQFPDLLDHLAENYRDSGMLLVHTYKYKQYLYHTCTIYDSQSWVCTGTPYFCILLST